MSEPHSPLPTLTPGYLAALPRPAMLEEAVGGARAWTRGTLAPEDWTVVLDEAAMTELLAAADDLAGNPVPLFLLEPGDYRLDACRAVIGEARRRLDDGPGVVVIDRLPIEALDRPAIEACFWLLGSLLGRPVIQTVDGQRALVEVTDTGIEKTVGVRGYKTRYPQPPHVDNSFNHTPPDYVSLLSLRKAVEGGQSHFVSFYAVHNRLRESAPDLLERLYKPFYQDRQGDFLPGESQVVAFPVFTLEPDLRCRYTHFTIPAGYRTAGIEFDELGHDAFQAITDAVMDPELHCEFTIEPGQLQIVNNRTCGHGRKPYVDDPDPARRRLLLRLWHRDGGRRCYRGF